MVISNWLKNLPGQRSRCLRRKAWQMTSGVLARSIDLLEDRTLLAADFGDAPTLYSVTQAEHNDRDQSEK